MRAWGITKYHLRRQWKIAILFTALMLIVSTLTIIFTYHQYSSMMLVFDGGVAQMVQDGWTMSLNFDYSSLYAILAWVIVANILRKERNFMITASSSRWEFTISLVLFALIYAFGLTALTYLTSVFNRLSLLLMGLRARDPWSVELILTGNQSGLIANYARLFSGMIRQAGYASLVYILFARWWKLLLILLGSGIAVLVVLSAQIRLGAYTQDMANAARALAEWIEAVFIPNIVPVFERIFSEQRAWVLMLRDFAQGAVCFALVYPVMLRMRIK